MSEVDHSRSASKPHVPTHTSSHEDFYEDHSGFRLSPRGLATLFRGIAYERQSEEDGQSRRRRTRIGNSVVVLIIVLILVLAKLLL